MACQILVLQLHIHVYMCKIIVILVNAKTCCYFGLISLIFGIISLYIIACGIKFYKDNVFFFLPQNMFEMPF